MVQNQPIASEKASLAAELIAVENSAHPKPQLKKISPRFHTPSRELVDVSSSESPPSLASPVAMATETQRIALGRSLQAEVETKKPSAALDLSKDNWGDVSTAARTLRNVDGNLSKTEAASPAGDTTFGAKRTGPPRVQRTLQGPILKTLEEGGGYISSAGRRNTAKTAGPGLLSNTYEKACTTNCRNKRGWSN